MEKREELAAFGARKPASGSSGSQSIPEKMSRKHTVMATKSPDRERRGLRVWWARRDLNPGPKDYACHHGFRRLLRVRGLDYTFPLRAGRLVSTPSPCCRGLARYRRVPGDLAFTEFDQFYPSPEVSWRRATHHEQRPVGIGASAHVPAVVAESSALTN